MIAFFKNLFRNDRSRANANYSVQDQLDGSFKEKPCLDMRLLTTVYLNTILTKCHAVDLYRPQM